MKRHVWSPVRGQEGRAGTGRAPPQGLPVPVTAEAPRVAPGEAVPAVGRGPRRCSPRRRPARILGRAAAPGSASESPRGSPRPGKGGPRPRAMARGRRRSCPGRGQRPAAGAGGGEGSLPRPELGRGDAARRRCPR